MRQRLILTGSGLLLASLIVLSGCKPEDKTTPKEDKDKSVQKDDKKSSAKHAHWWCREHGIPEDECLMCKFSEEELKKKGDWCEKHERAKSQCFKCDPKLREKYAERYRAKYGKEPPPIDDDEDEKKDEKKDTDKKDGDKPAGKN